MAFDPEAFRETLANARRQLLACRSPAGWWVGELSSSALSTATAAFALHLSGEIENEALVAHGLTWLANTQNADGGWGDTVYSFSNVSTTALCRAAFSAAKSSESFDETVLKAEAWLTKAAGDASTASLVRTIVNRYGKDRTFSVPILTMLALAGRLGEGRAAWRQVPQLPFELAACPHRWFQWIRLPVVSYALPALIAIGQVRHYHCPTRNPLALLVRRWTLRPTLRVLESIQPESGGFLEATPLTSFVTMSLLAAGQAGNPVTRRGIQFLQRSVLPDGSWPIDTNLATWLTTLSVNAMTGDTGSADTLSAGDRRTILEWLRRQQYRTEHPFTHAAPGGWAWTDLTGGVPDADDTSGALLALSRLTTPDEHSLEAARAGVKWLLDLQNSDGGVPTFCRGWGALPFDRSSVDITAHALLAWAAWRGCAEADLERRINKASQYGLRYILASQTADGAWAPLWFGNQHAEQVENLCYGTSRVLRLAKIAYLRAFDPRWEKALCNGFKWLVESQNSDGGWGGRAGTPSSIEETALAVEGLCSAHDFICGIAASDGTSQQEMSRGAIQRGINWLVENTKRGASFPPAPIGFYFANLWYFEKLYPLIFSVAALSQAAAVLLPGE
jgi:squalene-hopene/tetraprenyl-beta-curcumene cyclase